MATSEPPSTVEPAGASYGDETRDSDGAAEAAVNLRDNGFAPAEARVNTGAVATFENAGAAAPVTTCRGRGRRDHRA